MLTGSTQSANDTLYLHTDHLGSTEATTNVLGQFVNRMSFSTWGERQQHDWKPGTPTENFSTTNGFTGHDQLDNHNLVHMGGRVYDPNLGRFLSADIVVQSPYDSQSFNRYSYTFNNPLSYTDPTGYMSDMATYLMEQSYYRSSSWMWSSNVQACNCMVEKNVNWKTSSSTVNDDPSLDRIISERDGNSVITVPQHVSAANIFQTVSYNRMSWGFGFGRIYNLEPGIQEKCGGDADCAQQERIKNAVDFANLATLPYMGSVKFVGTVARIDKAADALKTGKVVAKATKRSHYVKAQLPMEGKIRYIPPKNWHPDNPLPRGVRGGYLDKFGNEWTKGPSRTKGEPFEWDVQRPDGSHWNISLHGKVTH